MKAVLHLKFIVLYIIFGFLCVFTTATLTTELITERLGSKICIFCKKQQAGRQIPAANFYYSYLLYYSFQFCFCEYLTEDRQSDLPAPRLSSSQNKDYCLPCCNTLSAVLYIRSLPLL